MMQNDTILSIKAPTLTSSTYKKIIIIIFLSIFTKKMLQRFYFRKKIHIFAAQNNKHPKK